MAVPLPNLTGGAATSGPATASGNVMFAPVNIGGLFGSDASSGSNLVLPVIIASVAVLAFMFFKKK